MKLEIYEWRRDAHAWEIKFRGDTNDFDALNDSFKLLVSLLDATTADHETDSLRLARIAGVGWKTEYKNGTVVRYYRMSTLQLRDKDNWHWDMDAENKESG